MAIVKMKRLRLIGLSREQDALLDKLQRAGCVQITLPEVDTDDGDWAELLHRKSSSLSQVDSELSQLEGALAILNRYTPAKEGLFPHRAEVTQAELFSAQRRQAALDIAADINAQMNTVTQSISEENRLLALRTGFLPWKDLDLPLEQEGTDHTELTLGVVQLGAKEDLTALHAELQEKAPLSELIGVSRDGEQQYVVLICHRDDFSAALEVLKSKAFSQIRFKGVHGTAAGNLAETDRLIEAQRTLREAAEGSIRMHDGDRAVLKLAIDHELQAQQKEDGRERLLCTEETFVLEGWFPERDEALLLAVLGQFTCAFETEEPSKQEYGNVPVRLDNGPLTSPLNMVTEMYSLPKYGSLDPNPLMAPFFVLFYGIMMADMGYGLMMVLGGLFLKKKKVKGTMSHMAGLLLLCGISTYIFGALTGGFFGDFIPQIAKIINPNTTLTSLPHLFTAQDDTIMILIGSLILGFLQCITGNAINVYKKCRDGDPLSAVFDEVAWWVLYASVAGFILGGKPVGMVLLIAGLVMLLIGQFRASGSVIGALGGMVGAIYNGVSGIFSDVLSYSRLMALMLSGAIIASVFNTLGAVPGNVVVFIIISMFGNILNFALNVLGCYVHDLRLQVLEFFGRFYEDGGKPFRPLTINTKYVDLIKEEN